MQKAILPITIFSLMLGCSDVPYQEKVIAKLVTESPVLELKSPTQNAYLSQTHIPLKGIISKPKLVKHLQVTYRGISDANATIKGTKDIPIKPEQNDWSIDVGDDLIDGDYAFNVTLVDVHGKEQNLPEVKITIDRHAPVILGAIDGVPQLPYRQETIHYRQRFLEEKGVARYEIEPVEDPAPLNYSQVPMIYRWLTRISDEKTAPTYTIKLADDPKDVRVKYSLSYECKPFENATKEAQRMQNGTYDIKITQSAADFDLSRNSEENARSKSYCLNIWAVDRAGNVSNHKAEFIWKVIVPPVSLAMNSTRYRAQRREDDISWLGPPAWKLFKNGIPIALKKDLVIGHVIMANPFSSLISSKLELKKGLELKINGRKYQIPAEFIDIKYFGYDLQSNKLGSDATLDDGSVIINAQKTVIAKFILMKDLPLTGLVNPQESFWQTFWLELGFTQTGNSRPVVDGLTLITRDAGTGLASSEFAIPWGNDHEVRRKSAPRQAH